jgi:hypothetical protein
VSNELPVAVCERAEHVSSGYGESEVVTWLHRGDAPAAQREIAEARRLYAETGATAHAERLAKEISP